VLTPPAAVGPVLVGRPAWRDRMDAVVTASFNLVDTRLSRPPVAPGEAGSEGSAPGAYADAERLRAGEEGVGLAP
jgi:hypothetical protein